MERYIEGVLLMVVVSDSERMRRVEEAELLSILFETKETQKKLAEQLRFINNIKE